MYCGLLLGVRKTTFINHQLLSISTRMDLKNEIPQQATSRANYTDPDACCGLKKASKKHTYSMCCISTIFTKGYLDMKAQQNKVC